MVEVRNLQRPMKVKGAPPKAVETHHNLAKPASGGKVPLQLKISPELRREFKNGEPERQGNERNFAKYQERVEQMRANIKRGEANLEALNREIANIK